MYSKYMVYNISYSIAALIILIVNYIFYEARYSSVNPSSARFKRLIIGIFVADLFDILSAVAISYSTSLPMWFNNLTCIGYFVSEEFPVLLFQIYIKSIIDGNEVKFSFLDKFNVAFIVAYAFLCLTSPFNKMIYYFDENALYCHGPWHIVVYFLPIYILIYIGVIIFKNRKQFEGIKSAATILFISFSVLGILIQCFIAPNVLFAFFAISIAASIILFSFETPDYYEMIKATDELKKSQEALQVALVDAEKANVAKSRFLSNMSHDIRTPMNAIIGFTDLALENPGNVEDVTDYLHKIQSSGEHLLSLINDILDMSKIESDKIELNIEDNNLIKNLENIKSMVLSNIVNKRQAYIEDYEEIEHKNIRCDILKLNQVLLNCIGNSIKFTPEGGMISVQVKEINFSDDVATYEFVIKDTGIGMSQEFLKNIFSPFERERTSTISNTQGTGLGMSITKSLVEVMNGNIRVESEEGKGTTYHIVIPFETVNVDDNTLDEEQISPDDIMASLIGKHILIVDDNEINRLLASKILISRGMTYEEAKDGSEAVARVSDQTLQPIDIVLMDIQMPVMNGYDAAAAIRNLDGEVFKKLPIIAMSADAFIEDVEKAIDAGMNSHVAKPVVIDDLMLKMYKVIR